MLQVQGDPDAIHASASAANQSAEGAGTQTGAVSAALAAIPPVVEVGPAADQMRAFGSELRAGMRAVSAAYGKVSAKLHQVATAVEDAQRAEKALEAAKAKLSSAKSQLATDQATEAAAQQAVDDANKPLTIGANPLAGPTGPTSAQLDALTLAKQVVTADAHTVQEATDAERRAAHAFQVADEHRQAELQSFMALCDEEAVVAAQAIPQAPANILDIAAVRQLDGEAASLLDLPFLTKAGFVVGHEPQVASALDHLDSAQLDAWTNGEVARLFPKPKSHSGGLLSSLYNLHLGPIDPGHFLGGVAKGTVGFVTGIPEGLATLWKLSEAWTAYRLNPVGPPPPDPFSVIWQHPLDFAKALVGWNEITKDPAKGVGELVPTLASFLIDGELEKGVDASKDLSTASAASSASELQRARWAETALKDSTPAQVKAMLTSAADLHGAASSDLRALADAAQERATILERLKQGAGGWDNGLKVAGGVKVLGSAANGQSDDPYGEDVGLGSGLSFAAAH